MTMSVPLILDVVGRILELPLGHSPTASKLLQQTFAINTQLGVGPIFAAHLKAIEQKPVRDVAVVLIDLFGQRFHFENPPAPRRQGAAELIVVRIIYLVVAVTTIYHSPDKVAITVRCVARALGLIGGIIDRESKLVDGTLIVSANREIFIRKKAN